MGIALLAMSPPVVLQKQEATFVIHVAEDDGPVPPGVFGVNAPDKYIDWTKNAAIGERLREGGFKVVRLGLVQDGIYQHRDIYPKLGSWNFAALDAMLKIVFDGGAEPIITIAGFPGGVRHRLDGEAKIIDADWAGYAKFLKGVVQHYNADHALGANRKIRYWEMWNEPTNEPDGKFTSREQYADLVQAVAPAMKEVDPEIKLIGPVHAWSDLGEGGWVSFGAKELGSALDILCWHDYGGGPDQPDAERMKWPRAHYGDNVRLVASGGPNGRFVGAGGKRFGAAITEYNMSWQSGSDEYNARYHSNYDAAFIGASLIEAIRAKLDLFCFYTLVQDGKNHLGLINNQNFRPYTPFEAFRLMATSLGARQLAMDGETAGVEALATKCFDGKIAVALANTNPTPLRVTLRLDGAPGLKQATVRQVTNDVADLVPASRKIEGGGSYFLPARSLSLVTIQ